MTAVPLSANLIQIQNRQRRYRISRVAVQGLAEAVLARLQCTAEIGIHFVGHAEMARVNGKYLGHPGSTDVITFDHGSTTRHLHGECFICVTEALAQSKAWDTTWQAELGRYLIHALLHLAGHDDTEPGARRVMKRRENALTHALVVNPGWRADGGMPQRGAMR